MEDFVGAGSSLKQLSLARVRDVDLSEAVTVAAGSPAADAIATAEAKRATGVVVLDDRHRPVDWIRVRQLHRLERVPTTLNEDLATLDEGATLNDALDTMLTSTFGSAVVTGERDRYLGMIDFETVTHHMRVVEEAAHEAVEQQ